MKVITRILVRILLAPIWVYQHCISPFTPPACRYTPTCSEYMKQAIVKYGPIKGVWLGIKSAIRGAEAATTQSHNHPLIQKKGWKATPTTSGSHCVSRVAS